MEAILPILSYALPALGKVLLMIPVVPNKVIPFILGAFNVAHKYWLLLGFPTALTTTSTSSGDVHLAGFGFVLPFVWGIAEQYLFHRFYEGEKLAARVKGTTSWWEKGKRSIY